MDILDRIELWLFIANNDTECRELLNDAADEIERLRAAVLFFAKHYDGPPDNMLTSAERELFQMPEMLKPPAKAAGQGP